MNAPGRYGAETLRWTPSRTKLAVVADAVVDADAGADAEAGVAYPSPSNPPMATARAPPREIRFRNTMVALLHV